MGFGKSNSVSEKHLTSSQKRPPPGPLKGDFWITGYSHMNNETKKKVLLELNEGDELILVPDPNNGYDNTAIKVMFNGVQLGWVERKRGQMRRNMFEDLIAQKSYECYCRISSRTTLSVLRRAKEKYADHHLRRDLSIWAEFEIKN